MTAMSVASVFTLALQGQPVTVWDGDRVPRPLPMHRWLGVAGAADRALLSLCAGPTVDVGCGRRAGHDRGSRRDGSSRTSEKAAPNEGRQRGGVYHG